MGKCPHRREDSSLLALLKACTKKKDIEHGARLHEDLATRGLLESNPYLASSLISLYAKCGALAKAHRVLAELHIRNVASWNALISGCTRHGDADGAMECFERMHGEGASPNAVTFICMLKACGISAAIDKGKQIHNKIFHGSSFLERDVTVGTALIDMYAKCGALGNARQVLEELPVRNVVSWNALIAGYTQQGHGHEALRCFELMRSEVSPDAVTFISSLKACGRVGDVEKGEQIHKEILSEGLLEKDSVLGCALVSMYTKCGMLGKAQRLLEEQLPVRNVVSLSALIAGLTEQGRAHEALSCFERMQSEGMSPDAIAFIALLKACGNIRAVDKGKCIHHEIAKKGLLAKDIVLGTALVDMYVKCGMLVQAQRVMEELPVRDAFAWSTLIAGYAQEGHGNEALNCYEQMQGEGLAPDSVTFICILKACVSAGAIAMGKQIHEAVVRWGLLDKDIVLGTSLVDMYAKCGMLEKAEQVLEGLSVRNVVSWSAIIAGYSQQGHGWRALRCFERMQGEGHCPNAVTFLSVLTACSHSGLMEEARKLFEDMDGRYGITARSEHHACMVAAFGCAGFFDEALTTIEAMPSLDSPIPWLALLGSCRKWGNVRLAISTFDRVVQLDNTCAAAYILMVDIFGAAGMRDDADKVEAMRLKYAAAAAASERVGSSLWVDTSRKFQFVLDPT